MKADKISIRVPSTDQDLKDIAALAKEIWEEHYTPIIGPEQVAYMLDKFQDFEAMQGQIAGGMAYRAIYREKDLLGYIGYEKRESALFISKYYVLASERGKGIGRLVLDYLKQEASKQDCRKLSLTVNKYNHNTIAAYEKWGFFKTDAVVADIGAGYVMDDYVMELSLTN